MDRLPESIEDKTILHCPHCKIEYSQKDLLKQAKDWKRKYDKYISHRKEVLRITEWKIMNNPKTCCHECGNFYVLAYAPAEKRFVDIHTEEYCHGSTT